ncbi:MAG: hypothetical protein FWD74_03350 [Actinomycetia bacterium]|nr:hypothetical protein [Actinomycetes bacterium]
MRNLSYPATSIVRIAAAPRNATADGAPAASRFAAVGLTVLGCLMIYPIVWNKWSDSGGTFPLKAFPHLFGGEAWTRASAAGGLGGYWVWAGSGLVAIILAARVVAGGRAVSWAACGHCALLAAAAATTVTESGPFSVLQIKAWAAAVLIVAVLAGLFAAVAGASPRATTGDPFTGMSVVAWVSASCGLVLAGHAALLMIDGPAAKFVWLGAGLALCGAVLAVASGLVGRPGDAAKMLTSVVLIAVVALTVVDEFWWSAGYRRGFRIFVNFTDLATWGLAVTPFVGALVAAPSRQRYGTRLEERFTARAVVATAVVVVVAVVSAVVGYRGLNPS